MTQWRDQWKKAFAVDADKPFQPTEPQKHVVDQVCREIARRHMTTPALLFLEMSRPLNYMAAQALHYFQPFASVVLDTTGYCHFAEFLEHRKSIDHLCRRLEHFERECEEREKKAAETDQSHGQPPESVV